MRGAEFTALERVWSHRPLASPAKVHPQPWHGRSDLAPALLATAPKRKPRGWCDPIVNDSDGMRVGCDGHPVRRTAALALSPTADYRRTRLEQASAPRYDELGVGRPERALSIVRAFV